MEIILMNQSHIAQIAALEQRSFTDPWSGQSIASELENPLALWLVAEEKGRVAGYIGSQSVLGEADMLNLAVAPEYRRQGLGTRLIEMLETALRQQGVYSLTLEVRPSNEAAIALYEKLGFFQVGLRRNYYEKPREDARILRKEWAK